MRRLLIPLLLLMAFEVRAEQSCQMALTDKMAQIREVVPAELLKINRFTGQRAQDALDIINAMEPPTDLKADTVVVSIWTGMPMAIVLLVTDDCVTDQLGIPASDAQRLAWSGSI